MAAVYRAYEPSLDRYVALKVLPSESLADPDFTVRFRREAKIIAGLEHRHIVPIYAYGIDGGVPWMAMRLVTGGTVAGELRQGPLGLGRTARILSEVASALDFAHRRGVLHRDVKPQNILLDDQGHAYLADFGVARMMEGTSAVTRSGVVTGTPLYMSPEQARGESVDHRTDVYALGIVAYEMVTGRVPFTADTPVAVLMKHIMEPLPLPSPSLMPEPVLRAVLKCVAKERNDRWPSGGQFALSFRAAVDDVSSTAARLSSRTTRTHLSRVVALERKLLGPFVAALMLGGALGVAYLGLTPRDAPHSSPPGPPEPTVAPTAASKHLGATREGPPRALPTPMIEPSPTPAPRSRPAPFAPTGSSPNSQPAARSLEPLLAPPMATAGPPTPAPLPTETMPATPPARADETLTDDFSFLIGRWKGTVRQRKNPFIHRELERPVSTECRRLLDPPRVFCKNDWGIIEDWMVVRHDAKSSSYLYEDSDGQRGVAAPGGDEIVYRGSRVFDGRAVSWRLTHHARGPDSFDLRMDWSRDSEAWHTIYEADFRRAP
jgi:serine/threonine-protein kinase